MRHPRHKVQDRWGRNLNEVKKIEQRNELALMIIGDLNNHAGSDMTGVTDNHDKITFGGELVRGLISSGDFVCMKNSRKAVGDLSQDLTRAAQKELKTSPVLTWCWHQRN